ncbi:hypothetical protein LDENG_00292900 [Lucifuga dentata]|nr:hypothetical protein LDENG_00292900 [Lucifuga dentata]
MFSVPHNKLLQTDRGHCGADGSEQRSVRFFVPSAAQCAVHFSTTRRAETRRNISTNTAPAPKSTKYRGTTTDSRQKRPYVPGKDSNKGQSIRRSSNRIKLVEGGIKRALLKKN